MSTGQSPRLWQRGSAAAPDAYLLPVSQPEVIVTIDGHPRPAVVIDSDGERTLVRFRDAGGHRQEWVHSASVVTVEASRQRPPLLKIAGLLAVGAVGLALLLHDGGSDTRLADLSPTPTPSPSAARSPSPAPTPEPTATAAPVATPASLRAVLFGDSFFAGRGLTQGQPGAAQVAAKALGWTAEVRGGDGTGFTTAGSRGGKPYAQRLAELTKAPDLLVLQGGASDTGASPEALTAAANKVIVALQGRFPKTRIVMMGPVAMEQPPDGQLVRVDGTLRAVAAAHKLSYLYPIVGHGVPAASAPSLTAASGFYPNAAGYRVLGTRLATELERLGVRAAPSAPIG
jgi:acyl-CoA thioesterase-1